MSRIILSIQLSLKLQNLRQLLLIYLYKLFERLVLAERILQLNNVLLAKFTIMLEHCSFNFGQRKL